MGEAATKLMTVEEFFAWEETQEESHELVDGVPVLRGERICDRGLIALFGGAEARRHLAAMQAPRGMIRL